MADENDPNGPEDDPPPPPPGEGGKPTAPEAQGEGEATPEALDNNLFGTSEAQPGEPPLPPHSEFGEPLPPHGEFEEPPVSAEEPPDTLGGYALYEPTSASETWAEPETPRESPETPRENPETPRENPETPRENNEPNVPSPDEASASEESAAPLGPPKVYEPPSAYAYELPTDAVESAGTEARAPQRDEETPEPPIPAAPPASEDDLPPAYFRAAGDPDEPEEAPPSQFGRVKARVVQTARDVWKIIEPHWVAFWGAVRGFFIDIWRRLRGVRRPRNIREAAVWSGWTAAVGVGLIVGFFVIITWDLPSTDDLWEARNGQSITFLDRNGNVILREGAQNAPPVDLASLPPYVEQAFIAIEDRRFYHHFGVDFGGMMRAGAENIRAGRVVQGGSTITQQLAKNLFLTNERSWRRKAQEVAMAIWLETRFTKEEILALYLSRVYFGAGAYGVEAAAERYFDRPARELTLLQSAMLAGLVKAPSRLNPARQDIAAARERATVVLDEMVAEGFISAAEREAALREELVISRRNPAGILGYYRDWIDPLLNDVIGQQRDDFIVETTLDIAAQRSASESVEAVLAEQGEARRADQAAALIVDDQGGVRAMVGGRDYDVSQFNRATQARRQPGSSFKFFIYLAAMENGLRPWSVREDAPVTIYIEGQETWTPRNYTGEYHGAVPLTSAFAQSYNMVAIRVAHEIGNQKVIDVARRLGVTSELHNYHSLALGAQEITLLEMAGAYGAMAANGYRVEPHGVARIRRANNSETMWGWRQTNRERVIDERAVRYMNLMMSAVVREGTGTRARMATHEVGGKTGTGNEYRDAWFIGFTPGLVGGVWVGNDNFTETARVTGGSLPADIWARMMPTALRSVPARPLEMPTEEDYDTGIPMPEIPTITAIGAPIGGPNGPPVQPPDDQDRSLDFGPEG